MSSSPPPNEGIPLEPTQTNKSAKDGQTSPSILRRAGKSFSESRPPVGMFHGWGSVASSIPTLNDIQSGNFEENGWQAEAQRRNSSVRRNSDNKDLPPPLERKITHPILPVVEEIKTDEKTKGEESITASNSEAAETTVIAPHDPTIPYENGYQFPPKHTWKQALVIGAKGSWHFVTTPFGFILTIYSLNIVAWGGMLFLILCRAAPAMNPPSCPDYNDKNCPNQVWLEICSQILNALFCVTGLGLIPWRFRDFYYLLQWRYQHNHLALRRLAGIHRGWFRLQDSDQIPPSFDQNVYEEDSDLPADINPDILAYPIKLSPDAPLTGSRAPASTYWKMDFVVWGFVWNTFLQIALCGVMWGFNRWTRPSWTTGLLISLACIVAMAAGWVVFKDGKEVKKVEGVPVGKEDLKILKALNEQQKEKDRVDAV